MKVGVIDIGTLKVKFLIVNIDIRKQIDTIYSSNTLTRLGVGMQQNNNIPRVEYIDATINELKRCTKILKREKVSHSKIVSTHVLREMGKAGQDLAGLINKETGYQVEIISQNEEADLFFKAVTNDFKTDRDFTIVDIGGGSVQIIIGNRKKLKDKFLLKMGPTYLFDKFNLSRGENDFPSQNEIDKVQKYIIKEIKVLPEKIKTPVVYGSSCVIDVFKQIGLNLQDNNFSKTHPYFVSIQAVNNFLQKIIPISYGKRQRMYKLDQPHYMWGLDKAFLNIVNICKRVDAPYIIPSNANINNGLVLSLLN